MKILREKELITTRWSGGTTTELFIYPETGSYAERSFAVRISKASVETEESDFTALPGYSRILMVLDGTLTMRHETGQETKTVTLNRFEQSAFSGDWKTTGYGQVKDFNVIFHPDYKAIVQQHDLPVGTFIETEPNLFRQLIFILSGTVALIDSQCVAGEVVIFEDELPLQARALTDCSLITVNIFLDSNRL